MARFIGSHFCTAEGPPNQCLALCRAEGAVGSAKTKVQGGAHEAQSKAKAGMKKTEDTIKSNGRK